MISEELQLTLEQYERVVFLYYLKDCTADQIAYTLGMDTDVVTKAIVQEMTNIKEMQKHWT